MQTVMMGFDFGNSESAGVLFDTAGHLHSLTIPSVSAAGTLKALEQGREASGLHDSPYRLPEDAYVLTCGNTEYYIGNLALTQSSDPHETRGDINRYWSESALHLLLTLAGSLVFDREFALHVVTGLPAETYNATNRRKVKEALEGSHTFWLNGQQHLAHVTVAKIVQEGASGIVLYGTKEPLKQAVIDIGGRTTDIFVARGQEPIPSLCRGLDKGVEYAGDLLSAHVQSVYGRQLTLHERRGVLRAHVAHEGYPPVVVSGSLIPDYELAAWTEDALRTTGRLICTFVSKVLKSNEQGGVGTDLASCALIGGGAHYFLSDIQALIPFAGVREKPEYANALAYAYFARRIVSQQGATRASA